MGLLSEEDRQYFFSVIDPNADRLVSSITLEEMEFLATSFIAAKENARIAQSNYANNLNFRAALHEANPQDKLIPALTTGLNALHEAWPDLLPAPPELPEPSAPDETETVTP